MNRTGDWACRCLSRSGTGVFCGVVYIFSCMGAGVFTFSCPWENMDWANGLERVLVLHARFSACPWENMDWNEFLFWVPGFQTAPGKAWTGMNSCFACQVLDLHQGKQGLEWVLLLHARFSKRQVHRQTLCKHFAWDFRVKHSSFKVIWAKCWGMHGAQKWEEDISAWAVWG